MTRLRPILGLFLSALAIAALLPLFGRGGASVASPSGISPEWAEARWLPVGAAPVRRPLTALEESFAARFPGHIARFTDGSRTWIVRVMDRPTRMLHPAADCFRGLGYRVEAPKVRTSGVGTTWRCFMAEKNGRRLQACERIFDEKGGEWTDASSWYWSALLGRDGGPWWAVTQVEG